MSSVSDTDRPGLAERELVAAQTGRPPRTPWRVAVRCSFGHPVVIASPSRLDDGTPFPNWLWLTCPHLVETVSAIESSGGAAKWAASAAADYAIADGLRRADALVREARARESAGEDACASVGIAGQRDPLGVKCLHARVALALGGIEDPVGLGVLAEIERECTDDRCASLRADKENR